MVLQTTKHRTVQEFDEFVQLPENTDKLFEYVGGDFIEVVSNPYSSAIAYNIGFFIKLYLREKGVKGHVTGADGGYVVSGERYIPDVAYISYKKQHHLPYDQGYNPNPPDLAVEVLSPGNTDVEMRIKVIHFLQAGTTLWIVDPQQQRVEVYTPGKNVQLLYLDDVLSGGDVLPDFQLPVKDIFPEDHSS